MDSSGVYIARLIVAGNVHQVIEFQAPDASAAWIEGNDGVDPLNGLWVEVKAKPEPQGELSLA